MEHFPFWHFFGELEKVLGYKRDMGKYVLFLEALTDHQLDILKDWVSFERFARALLLQHSKDAARFGQLLEAATNREDQLSRSLFLAEATKEDPSRMLTTPAAGEKPPVMDPDPLPPPIPEEILTPDDDMPEPPDNEDAGKQYFNIPPALQPYAGPANTEAAVRLLQTDEYFPLTRRQMAKGWQLLRNKEKGAFSEEMDLPQTVRQIAMDGCFITPRYKRRLRNREDTLIIFADQRGSMAPFHELTRRLIETAQKGGGHPRVPVFYFQNVPSGVVYRKSNMFEPVKLKTALQKANKNITLAVVISDAGAARANTAPPTTEARYNATKTFLDTVHEACNNTIWINPMPAHRWPGTTAEKIRRHVLQMTPVLDHDHYSLQDTLRTIYRSNA